MIGFLKTYNLNLNKMEKFLLGLGAVIVVILIVAVIALLLAFPVMLLWNWLMPVIFGLPAISFWQALGLNLLSGFLFKSSSTSSSSSN